MDLLSGWASREYAFSPLKDGFAPILAATDATANPAAAATAAGYDAG